MITNPLLFKHAKDSDKCNLTVALYVLDMHKDDFLPLAKRGAIEDCKQCGCGKYNVGSIRKYLAEKRHVTL